jgi:hypothetical protein
MQHAMQNLLAELRGFEPLTYSMRTRLPGRFQPGRLVRIRTIPRSERLVVLGPESCG